MGDRREREASRVEGKGLPARGSPRPTLKPAARPLGSEASYLGSASTTSLEKYSAAQMFFRRCWGDQNADSGRSYRLVGGNDRLKLRLGRADNYLAE